MSDTIRVMMLGDVTGSSGMGALFLGLSSIVKEKKVSFVIVNGENAASGYGITIENYNDMKKMGIDVITSGNHIWQKNDIFPILEKNDDILRPINYPEPCVGTGYTLKECGDVQIGVINGQGRVDMYDVDDPFKKVEMAVERLRKKTPLIFVDFHAESSDEKEALAFYLDGRVSAVVGTHTHVQTADERILPNGSAYITDLGLTGDTNGVIGFKASLSIERQLTQIPFKSEVSDDKGSIQGVVIECDKKNGKALSIERFTF